MPKPRNRWLLTFTAFQIATLFRCRLLAVFSVALRVVHILLVTAAGWPALAQNIDSLPRPAFDDFPERVRVHIRTAYDEAKQHPGDALRAGRLAMLLHAYEQLRLAEACYRRAQALDPTGFQWFYLAGVAQAELGEHARAVSLFRAALALDEDHLAVRLRLADALLREGKLEASWDEYSHITRRAPELALAHYGLGRVSALRGDSETAAGHFKRAVELVPQFGAAHYALGIAYRDLGKAELALKHMETFQALGPTRPPLADALVGQVVALRATGRDLLADAARLGSAGQLEESIARHLAAIDADPTAAAQAHVNLISLYGRQGNTEKARQHYRAALRLGTSLVDAHYNYGVLLASMRRPTEAAAMFGRVLELNPFHAQAHNNLATLLVHQHQMEQALGHYLQALAIDPEHRSARRNVARTLVTLGRLKEAIPHLERALRLDEDAPDLLFALAGAWQASGDRTKAIEYAQNAQRTARARGQGQLETTIDRFLRKLGAKR